MRSISQPSADVDGGSRFQIEKNNECIEAEKP